ncbi:ABC-F family ATP-binding cassette domain-containing protein [Sphingobium sp. Sx8-8]|uniref:ABC-F family ATP-binding cassette domain-containing protein n=1 Tax=Sphingobium sp. Sx8-8 TaxID=2933617 RepID=UPI001F57BFBD|nr:ABC-F family ATP-binding cassette domain-containing protein [Sphingobium sp. Sx8-8]
MSSFLTLHAVALAAPSGRPLFSGLSLHVGCECIGLVGRNGAGKSSLLRAILGEIAPRSGSISLNGTVGVLHQMLEPGRETAAKLLGVAEPLALPRRIEAGKGSEADFAEADWSLPQRLEEALASAGLRPIDPERPLASFSGGERTRIAIAGLLIDPPNLLLLDEPTNNLDEDGRAAIAALLAGWRGGALVVSHDRMLLEQMDRIVSLSPVAVAIHGGGWSSWVAQRDAARARSEAELESAGRQMRAARRQAQDVRERQARRDRSGQAYAASGSAPKILMGRQRERAENSGGRGQMLVEQRLEASIASLAAARAQVEIATPLNIAIPSCGLSSHRRLLSFDAVSWSAGERTVIDRLSFELQGPERVAVTGRNGAGKTTVLRLAAGLAVPTSGSVARSGPSAFLDQSVALLDRDATLIDNMRRFNPALDDNAARAALARFAFRNVGADRLTRTISGGECLRAGLACLLSAQPTPQLLMLDEPTNHLDLESIELIEQALRAYDGALLVVSHDRRFLEALGVGREIRL